MTGARTAALLLAALLLVPAAACDGCRHDGSSSSDAGAVTEEARSPAEVRRSGNHLVGQASLYLQQHAHNPVDWYPWTPEALARAKTLGRPIFLSVGYASCHWCHVMEEEVFENDEVASELNAHFVAIKVDREERPDVDAVSMDALQAMTGSGGWPTSLFLTPDLEPFFGGTYFPKAKFLEIARRAAKELAESRASVAQRGAELRDRIAQVHAPGAPGGVADKLRTGEIEALARRALGQVDEGAGGFRGRTKFPNPASWRFLLHAARKWGGEELRGPVRRTLDAMAQGGLFDAVGGGFFRYTTDPGWTVPHFEKMLYTNAALARLYVEAYAVFGQERDLAIARQTLDFLLREMADPAGGFYASLDADSGGKEGAFYVFTAAEMKGLLGADAPAAMKAFGATEAGNFEGANVLTLRSPEAQKTPPSTLEAWRTKLAGGRSSRTRPRLDEKLVTSWNGLAIEAFARGFVATGDARYRDAAVRAADRLWTLHRPGGRLVRTSTGGKVGGDAMLDDYATFALGLVAIAEATGDPGAIERAAALVTSAVADFAAPNGAFYSAHAGGPFERRIDPIDSEEPSGPGALLEALERLAALTGKATFTEALDRGLAAHADGGRSAGISAASLLDAALLDAGPFYDVVLAGEHRSPLAAVWREVAPSWAVRVDVGASGPTPPLLAAAPPTEGKTAPAGKDRAYVCVHGACKEPTDDPSRLRAQLREGWAR